MNESNLHGYQRQAVDHIINQTHCGLFLEMGLGKTVSTLTAINRLMYEHLEISKVLVIGPKRVVESVWDAECKKWEHLSHLTCSKIIGTERQRMQALKTKADIHLISRDNIAWLCGVCGGTKLPFDMLVIDELSSFKNPKSVRFKALRKTQASFQRVVGLTGTPSPNGLMDLWAQVYLLDRGERLGAFITEYRRNFFYPAKSNGHMVYKYGTQAGAEKIISEKISDICMSMTAKDYLDLPKRIINDIVIPLGDKLQAKYDEFEREKIMEMVEDCERDDTDSPVITALNAAGLSNKLLQFANGAVYDENKDVHVVHDLKLEAAKELVEDAAGKPVLIAWNFRHDLQRLKEKLKAFKPRELKDNQDIDDWNAGKIQVLLMHPASGGHGLNLQAGGNIIIWYGLNWSLELEQQFNARLHRQGQKEAVIINRLLASKTIDMKVARAIRSKGATQADLMAAVKARILEVLK